MLGGQGVRLPRADLGGAEVKGGTPSDKENRKPGKGVTTIALCDRGIRR